MRNKYEVHVFMCCIYVFMYLYVEVHASTTKVKMRDNDELRSSDDITEQ